MIHNAMCSATYNAMIRLQAERDSSVEALALDAARQFADGWPRSLPLAALVACAPPGWLQASHPFGVRLTSREVCGSPRGGLLVLRVPAPVRLQQAQLRWLTDPPDVNVRCVFDCGGD